MVELEEADHLVGGRGQSGIGGPEQPRQHGALMLLPGEDQVFAHRQLRKHLQQLEGAADAEPVELGGPHAGDDLAVDLHFARRSA